MNAFLSHAVGPEKRYFLDVRRSVTGVAWVHRLTPRQEMTALAIAQGHGVPEIVARVLAGRNVPAEGVERFLDPTIRELLPDPSRLMDMDAAAARLADAVTRGERIAIFGDYDVDGACSSALMRRFLAHGREAEIYIPDRIFEGYGPNPAAIESSSRTARSLIVTVDCGTTSTSRLPRQAPARMSSSSTTIRWARSCRRASRRQSEPSGRSFRPGSSCAAGVTFLFLMPSPASCAPRNYAAGHPEPDLLGMLDLVALATVCDVVPLTGRQPCLRRQGLMVMRGA